MNRIALCVLTLILSVNPFSAQTTSDCEGGIILCDSFYSEETAPVGSGDIYEPPPALGCNGTSGEINSIWYIFTVQDDGDLNFILNPNDDATDYDWSLYNISQNGCNGILDGTSPEVSCNSWGTTGINGDTGISSDLGGTGNSNGPGDLNGPPYNGDLPVSVGETFALVVMNWTSSPDGYSLDFGGSTASLYDQVPPVITDVEANCANTELTITFSENIVLGTVQIDDFNVSGSGIEYSVTDFEAANGGSEMDNMIVVSLGTQIVSDGSYTLEITNINDYVTDLCGNEGSGTFTFELSAPMLFEAETTTACNGFGGSISVNEVTGGASPFVYSLNGNEQNDPTFDNLSDGSYSVGVEDQNGCLLTQQLIVPNQDISVDAGIADSLSCVHPSTDLGPATVEPEQNVSYLWFTDEGAIIDGATSASATAGAPGTYAVQVINLENGCSANDIVVVSAEEQLELDLSQLVFPNIFTPNADDFNGSWSPFLANDPEFDVTSIFSSYNLQIFDRWGKVVFESDGANRKWRAIDKDEGTYFYTVTYESQCGSGDKGEKEGYIQILR
jgi:gliding motility-associated-like protein